MTWQQNIFQILIVTSTAGSPTGFFEYSGAPVFGNPPIAYAAAPGVTKDPFGNTLPSSNGGFTAISAGATIVNMTQGSIGLNSLNASTKILATGGGGVQLIDTQVVSGQPAVQVFGPATNVTDITAAVVAFGQSQDTTKPAQVLIDANGLGPHSPLTTALLEVQGAIQTTSLASIIANGNLQTQLGDCTISAGKLNIAAATTPGQPGTGFSLHDDANSFPRVKVALAGDTNDYFTVYTSAAASATPQTISSTTPATITGCTLPVGIGQYEFRARVVFQGAAASGTANFSMSAPANTSPEIDAMFNMSTGTAGAGVQLAALGPVNSPTQTTGNSVADITGTATFTASGNLILQCATSAGGANVLIGRARLWLYPIL